MDKRFFSRILLPLALVVVAALWLVQIILDEFYPDSADIMAWYSLAWAVTTGPSFWALAVHLLT